MKGGRLQSGDVPRAKGNINDWADIIDLSDEEKDKKIKNVSKEYKEGEIMSGKSELVKKGKKYSIDTELKVKKGLEPKVKRALKKSVVEELDKRIKGSGIKKKVRKIELDLSSDEEPIKRKRGRPKKGGMIGDDEPEVYKSKLKAKPLIRDAVHQDAIDEYLDNISDDEELMEITGGEKFNVMDIIDQTDLDKTTPEDLIKKHNIIMHMMQEIDPDMDTPNYIKQWSDMTPAEKRWDGRNKTDYILEQSNRAKNNLKVNKREIEKFFNVKKGTGIKSLKKGGKVGKGYIDSSSDEEDVKEYSKILKHLISHITDKKEKVDKRDFKQAKELIDKIKKKK